MANWHYIHILPNCRFKNMTKKITKKESMLVAKFTTQEAKNTAILTIQSIANADKSLKDLAEKQLPHISHGEIISDEVMKNMVAVSLAYSQESGCALMESIDPRYRGFALQLRESLQREFDCKNPSEIALVDQAVNSHIRKITYSKLMESRNEPEWLSHEKVALLNFYSREIDRAHRQFISSIETLKFIKQPSIKVNVKTNNAFIGENQQFNNNQTQKDENNEAR